MASAYQIVRFDTNGGYIIPEYDREYEYEVGKTYGSQKAFPPSSFRYTTSGGASYTTAYRWGGRNGRSWQGYSGTNCGPTGNIASGSAIYGYRFWNSLAQAAFLGWYTSPTGGTRVLDSEVCNLTRDITLYAHWDFTTMRLIFDPCGGEFIAADGSRSSEVITQAFDLTYNKPYGRLPKPYREGCVFEGWYTLPKAATLESHAAEIGVELDPFEEFYYFGDELEAVRNYPAGGFKISAGTAPALDDAGGYLSGVTALTASRDTVRVAILINAWRERDDRDFWEYFPRLYAHWSDGASSSVSLDYQGGEAEAMAFAISAGESLPTLPVPVRSGYTFLGYYTGANQTGEKYADALGAPLSTWHHKGDVTLYAAWQRDPITVTMVWQTQYETVVLETMSAIPGSTYGSLPVGVVTGRRFVGWYDTTFTSANEVTGESVVPDAQAVTLYGRFEVEYYPVTLITPHAEELSGSWSSYWYGATEGTALPDAEEMNALWPDHVFLGWYKNHRYDGAVYTHVPTDQTGPQTFYAKWETTGSRTVTFNSNLEGYEPPVVETRTVALGEAIGEMPKLEMPGYVFDGWYDGDGLYVFPSRRVTDDLQLYGHWRLIEGVDWYYVH